MFTAEDRARVQDRLLRLAEADGSVTGAALTGSQAVGAGDRWSDIDLVVAVRGEPAEVCERWTERLYEEFGALHHWDLPAVAKAIRVFLLADELEVDLTFAPEAEFGARGPQWRTLFGSARTLEPFPDPGPRSLIGHAWHHALHARTCIARGRSWQAEHWISALRDQVVALACLRLGHPAFYAKGAHLLPPEVTDQLEPALVRSLDAPELSRALAAAAGALAAELGRSDPALAARLRPVLLGLAAIDDRTRSRL
ncbi:MAG TPA: nucleotidyltransferase domain-containing protein [Actinocrinis sp.]|nr:nucleotidyltransferase domain-containing protein [Actinocrinis sp.]